MAGPMDWCCTGDCSLLTSLPDEEFDRVLSLLPTKDVAVLPMVSKRLGHVFSCITSIDLDALPKGPSRNCLLQLERFPKFISFVTKVLLQPVDRITRFRLRFGGDKTTHTGYRFEEHICTKTCFPNVEPGRLNAWLSYPLAHSGLRDLELVFRLRNPGECKLPPQLFDLPSLESFRVDANIKINSPDIPLICLPNLKLMHINSVLFNDDDFVTRLVSSCLALEDLCIMRCFFEFFDRFTIASHSLRRMVVCLVKLGEEGDEENDIRNELVTIDTPNLQYMYFGDELAYFYSITHMNFLVEAHLHVTEEERLFDGVEISVESQLSLLSAFTDVQRLGLHEVFVKALFNVVELDQHLPVFHNLKTITLGPGIAGEWRWDIVLPLILHSSPLLENLVFPRGIISCMGIPVNVSRRSGKKEAHLEAEGLRANTLTCLTHLKRFEIGRYFGLDRELNMISFFLDKAPALKEVVLCLHKRDSILDPLSPEPNFEKFMRKLEKLQRAFTCSFIVL